MLIDSHCHLPSKKDDLEVILNGCIESGVLGLINIGTSISESKKALEIAQKFNNIWASAAVYPHEHLDLDINSMQKSLIEIIEVDKKESKKVVAIGECGIDITEHVGRSVKEQEILFRMQADLALNYNLPLIIHNRNGDEIVYEVLKSYNGKLKGVMHCFCSSREFGEKFMELGFLLSFSGMVTYKSRIELAEIAKAVPSNMYIVETDSPYLPPQGFRGQENKPEYVKIVAHKLAELRQIPFEQVCSQTTQNAIDLFNLKVDDKGYNK